MGVASLQKVECTLDKIRKEGHDALCQAAIIVVYDRSFSWLT